jgi:hypothetical protein
MGVSAEVRWFWPNAPPLAFKDWFLSVPPHPYAAGGAGATSTGSARARPDEYLSDPGQLDLGIKTRGGKRGTEIKGLVTRLPDVIKTGPFRGSVDIWCKWTSMAFSLSSLMDWATSLAR